MGGNNSPRNRGPNVGVSFPLAQFIERFFACLGTKASFTGPGPLSVLWHSSTTSRAERFAIDHLANEMMTKFDDGVKSPAKRHRAISRFEDGEVICALTNAKFGQTPMGQCPEWLEEYSDRCPDQQAVFSLARKHISRVLGAFPGWDRVLSGMDFGPGATTRLSRRESGRYNKWAGSPHATPFLSGPLSVVFDDLPLIRERLAGPCVEIHAGNKLDWVPKNYKTDRTIAVEPDWNMFIQKGLGAVIRRRLRRVGIDLNDQSNNQFLAAVGSIDGSVATLDLSMASDTVAYGLVEYLIRPDWFEALKQCRSEVGFYSGDDSCETAVIYQKFSSMGNGFTFELETLIFWGICRAVSELVGGTDHRLYVYGDDIVVPTGIAGHVVYYLRMAGFHVNPDKSFMSGPFRESCGGHYFEGCDVTPFYVREPVSHLDRLFLLHNNVYRWLSLHPGICEPEVVRELLHWIRGFAPPKWQRPRLTASNVGDGAFIGSFDEVCPSPIGRTKEYRGWEGWRSQTLQYRPKSVTTAHTCKSFLCDPGCPRAYPEGSGPDLAALYSLEKEGCRLVQETWKADRASLEMIVRLSEQVVSSPNNVPMENRYWFEGVQVLPWDVEVSWW